MNMETVKRDVNKISPKPAHTKLAILTTDTSHHLYFVKRLGESANLVQIIIEEREITLNYESRAKLDQNVLKHEENLWFKAGKPLMEDFAPTIRCESVNDDQALKALKQQQPDILIAFGVGRLENTILNYFPQRILNVQATDPEYYCGLDTLYWAAFHSDFDKMSACLNLIEAEKQQGSKILKYSYAPAPETPISHLRALFTERSITAARDAVMMYSHFGQFIHQPQNYNGRFYYFFPADLKDLLENKFAFFLERYWDDKRQNCS